MNRRRGSLMSILRKEIVVLNLKLFELRKN